MNAEPAPSSHIRSSRSHEVDSPGRTLADQLSPDPVYLSPPGAGPPCT
ncbi:hypothetical protein GDO81_024857 [Engystomops pustulosus]|uniref:Uncharacterized protein n=1 Tax=Engystomops pustulosus TaxID=76066 RepID=A0AAV6YI58_ENGPU|nr:hypothetical protein GDO81_024857 [Engystomops pustulosus]